MNFLTNSVSSLIGLATLVASIWAFVHCLRTRPDAFPAIGRQSKGLWLGLTGGAALLSLLTNDSLGIVGIASIVIASVYLLDIRPRITEILSGR